MTHTLSMVASGLMTEAVAYLALLGVLHFWRTQ